MLTDVQAFSRRAYPLRVIHPLSTPFPPAGFQSVANENRHLVHLSSLIQVWRCHFGRIFGYTEYKVRIELQIRWWTPSTDRQLLLDQLRLSIQKKVDLHTAEPPDAMT